MSVGAKNAVIGVVIVLVLGLAVYQFTRPSSADKQLDEYTETWMDEETLKTVELTLEQKHKLIDEHGIKYPELGSTIECLYNAETGEHTLFRARWSKEKEKWYIPSGSNRKPVGL